VDGEEPVLAELGVVDGDGAVLEVDVSSVQADGLADAHASGGQQAEQGLIG